MGRKSAVKAGAVDWMRSRRPPRKYDRRGQAGQPRHVDGFRIAVSGGYRILRK